MDDLSIYVKAKMSNASLFVFSYNFGMSDSQDEALFNNAYCARLRELREERGWSADQMATALGIPADRYRKYETRSPLPAYLVERVSIITGTDVEYVLIGKTRRQVRATPVSAKRQA